MTEPAAAVAPPVRVASRGRVIAARVLVVLGIVLTVVSLLANFVKREALDSGNFKQTSREMIGNDDIRNQLAATMVEQLYANVDVSTELKDQLPKNFKGLSGPIAGISRELADRAARELLQRPAMQQLFVTAASTAQAQLIAVLDGDTTVVSTTNGNVALDLRPLVLKLGERFQFVSNLADRVPQDSTQVTILKSDDLSTAQTLTQWLKATADWIWVLALAAWAAALWLVPGRRRKEVRAIGVGLMVAGVLVLVIRHVAGTCFVDNLVTTESVRPAASAAWEIVTDGLAASGWVALWVGFLAALGAWLTGDARRAVAARRSLAPHLRRTEIAYGGFAVLLFLALWLLPLQESRTTLLLIVVSVVGFEVLRRQVEREIPEPASVDMLGGVRERISGMRMPGGRSRTEELERLAKLHDDGHLTDEEYTAAKARLI